MPRRVLGIPFETYRDAVTAGIWLYGQDAFKIFYRNGSFFLIAL